MNQIDDLRRGDLVVFIGEGGANDCPGYVVGTDVDPHDEQALLIQFMGKDTDRMPLHYYYHELDDYLEAGEIRIQRG